MSSEECGFVYIWYDSGRSKQEEKRKSKFYIGCHLGSENDKYICSSPWMLRAYNNRPDDFKRKFLSRNIPKELLLDEEYKWLQLIKEEELKEKYYNLQRHHFGHWTYNQEEERLSQIEKMRKSLKQYHINHPEAAQAVGDRTRGRKDSPETVQKKIAKLKGNSHTFGKHHTKKREKITFTEERKEKARIRMIGNEHNNPDKSRENLIKARAAHIAAARPIPDDFVEQCGLLGSNRKLSLHYNFGMGGIKKWREQAGIPEFKQLPPPMREMPTDFEDKYKNLKTETKLKEYYGCGSDTVRRWKSQYNK